MATAHSNSILEEEEETFPENIRGFQSERIHNKSRLTEKKDPCCDKRWEPFWPVERQQPSITLRTKGPTKTIYQKDFITHPIGVARDMKNDLWTTFQTSEPMELTTTMRNDYKPINVFKHAAASTLKKPNVTYLPFAGKSSYRREFVDWKGNQAMMTLPVQPSTVVSSLPFLPKTNYREDYITPPRDEDDLNEKLRAVNKQKGTSSLFPAVPLLGMSTYVKDFKALQGAKMPRENRRYDVHGEVPYPGQYETLTQAEYTDPRKKYVY